MYAIAKTKKFWGLASTPSGLAPVTGPPYSFRNTASSTATGAALSASIDIGTAAADRLVILATAYQSSSATVSAATAAGTSLSQIISQAGAGGGFITLHAALVTTGSGSQTVSVTWSSGTFQTRGFAVWIVNALSSNTAKQTLAVQSGALSIPAVAGDLLVGIQYASAAGGITFTGGSQSPSGTHNVFTANPSATAADWIVSATNASFHPNGGGANFGVFATYS